MKKEVDESKKAKQFLRNIDEPKFIESHIFRTMDHLTPRRRSWNMSRIHSKNTTQERVVGSYLRKNGIGYRKNVRGLPGTPDFVLSKYHAVIFVNGCFWHGHDGCKLATIPKTHTEWWMAKIQKNRERDEKNTRLLKSSGWRVFTIWECELEKNPEYQLKILLKELLLLDNRTIPDEGPINDETQY